MEGEDVLSDTDQLDQAPNGGGRDGGGRDGGGRDGGGRDGGGRDGGGRDGDGRDGGGRDGGGRDGGGRDGGGRDGGGRDGGGRDGGGRDGGGREVCRDYMRNVCTKGDRCRYKHPVREDIKALLAQLSVCHDFQNNRGCRRDRCKYVHITVDEETYIRETGRVPEGMEAERRAVLVGDIPMCTDFLRGQCTRGDRCKFIHSSQGSSKSLDPPSHGQRFEPYGRGGSSTPRATSVLRRLHEDDLIGAVALEEEVALLRHQMTRLRRQVAELKVTNEDLMAENAQLRVISVRRGAAAGASSRSVAATSMYDTPDSYAYGDAYY